MTSQEQATGAGGELSCLSLPLLLAMPVALQERKSLPRATGSLF